MSKADAYIGGASLIFTPVKDFDVGVEVVYERLNQHLTGTNGAAPTIPVVAGIVNPYSFKPSSGIIETRMRVERTF